MSSDDEDLKLAIAQSLAESMAPVRHDDPIIISSDDDEHGQAESKPAISPADPAQTKATATNVNTFLSERAQLEAARLARLKRMRESKPQPVDDPFVSSDEDDGAPPAKKSKLSACASYHASRAASSGAPVRTNAPVSTGAIVNEKGADAAATQDTLFWAGELRQTANMHVDKARDTRPVFRLSDILGKKSDLTLCILSSYVTQLSWIYSLLPPALPVILVAQPGEDGARTVHNVLPNWVKITPQLRGGRGCMHIKFILLFYKTGRARLVITTANLVDYDWRDVENSVFTQDLPPRPHAIPPDVKADDFPAHFERVLEALGVGDALRALRVEHPGVPLRSIKDLRCGWDFSKVIAHLVPSLAGKHEGWGAVLRVGHVRLMHVVRLLGGRADGGDAESNNVKGKGEGIAQFLGGKGQGRARRVVGKRELQLECQTSSIGSYTPAWLDEFLTSARGASPEAWIDTVKARRVKAVEARVKQHGWGACVKILFPSLRTVKASRLGEDGAGTMFCQRRQWNGPKFPRELFYDSSSRRGPVLMHSKMILAVFRDADCSPSNTNTASTSNVKTKPSAHPKSRRRRSPTTDSSATEPSSESDNEVEEVDPERDASVLGWVYVGSHNFTPSAWGTLSGSSVLPIMNITNYELGIVFPIKGLKQADEIACWDRPPRKYDLAKDEPWIQSLAN